MSSKKIVVAGHACLDITPVFPKTRIYKESGEVLSPGKLVEMDGVEINAGGAVSNTGLAMKLLGVDVRLAAKIGTDAFGKLLNDIYQSYGVDKGILLAKGERTSYSVVLAIPGIDRIFLHDPGCNHTFSLEDIKRADLEDAALFHFGYPPLMRKMYENKGRELAAVMRYVKSRGIATSLDLAFVDENSEAGKADWKEILKRVLPCVDFFLPSVEELCFMLDRERYESWVERAQGREIVSILEPEQDIAPLAKKCMELGTRVLLLKCGAPGLYYQTADNNKLTWLSEKFGLSPEDWADKAGFEKSYRPDRVLSGTGAGDTTIAAFLTAALRGYPLAMCVQLAAAEGACCVAEYDALSGVKLLGELEARIKAGWEKYE